MATAKDETESKKEEIKDEIKDDIVGNCYQIGDVLGSGTFGELRLGINLITKQLVAIKLESKDLNPPQLELEFKFYQILGTQQLTLINFINFNSYFYDLINQLQIHIQVKP